LQHASALASSASRIPEVPAAMGGGASEEVALRSGVGVRAALAALSLAVTTPIGRLAPKKRRLGITVGCLASALLVLVSGLLRRNRLQGLPPDEHPIDEFIDWRDPGRRGMAMHSEMLLVRFHRYRSVLELLRRFVASYVSRLSPRLGYRMVPEMIAPPQFTWKRPTITQELRQRLADAAEKQHHINGGTVRVFFTGVTGFIGQEFLVQAAADPAIEEVFCLIWDRERGDLSPEKFREKLLGRQAIDKRHYSRFHMLWGDISKDRFGLAPDVYSYITGRITHVIHCAANVSFSDPYEKSYRANVLGARNACIFAEQIQRTPENHFVSLVLIETCYIHGANHGDCLENDLDFPSGYYNNFYEVTKAMASIDGERFLASGVRLAQLCPAIVMGRASDGNNNGDTKTGNALINIIGRAHMEAKVAGMRPLRQRVLATCVSSLARTYPADPHGSFDSTCVDRVVQGMLASLSRPQAVAHRVHLATHPDMQITAAEVYGIIEEELGVRVNVLNPILHHCLWDPLIAQLQHLVNMGDAIPRLRNFVKIFGAYFEWGASRHMVGNDMQVLGLGPRPEPGKMLRIAVRHNQFVQKFGKCRGEEVFWRERVWEKFCVDLAAKLGVQHLGDVPPGRFRDEARVFESLVRDARAAERQEVCAKL